MEVPGGVRANMSGHDKWVECIKKFPQFPFAYLYLSTYLKGIGDTSWKDVAHKGIAILKITTQIAGHQPDHDTALKQFQAMNVDSN